MYGEAAASPYFFRGKNAEMQGLVEKIAKIEEAAERVKQQADQEKRQIEAAYWARMSETDQASEEAFRKTLEQFKQEQRGKTETELKRQREAADERIARIAGRYEEAHEQLCSRIMERILKF